MCVRLHLCWARMLGAHAPCQLCAQEPLAPPAAAMAWHPDGKQLAVGLEDGQLLLLNTEDGEVSGSSLPGSCCDHMVSGALHLSLFVPTLPCPSKGTAD